MFITFLFLPLYYWRSFIKVLSEANQHFGKIYGSRYKCLITNTFSYYASHLHIPKEYDLTLIYQFFLFLFLCLCVLQENDSGTLDTVGAVVVDQEGNVAAAVSSGGLALKHPGRVGQVIIVPFF